MAAMFVTPEDLQIFKKALLEDFRKLLNEKQGSPVRKWLKSHEVRRILTISPGTLQNLRVNGTLPFTKLGGVLYYDPEDIQKMLEQHKTTLGRCSS
ncbi:MAG TPA: helix-turn-helix domain-containing protein [Cyclobacteriaceae bacterium]|nr:helix-turn-helix domain-containing protein [Cyclobacteriaceae bacterium]